MWKQLVEYGRQIFALTSRVQRHEEDIKELRQDLKEVRDEIQQINRRLDALAGVVQLLVLQRENDREAAARERENLVLRLENALLRFERRLPTGSPPEGQIGV